MDMVRLLYLPQPHPLDTLPFPTTHLPISSILPKCLPPIPPHTACPAHLHLHPHLRSHLPRRQSRQRHHHRPRRRKRIPPHLPTHLPPHPQPSEGLPKTRPYDPKHPPRPRSCFWRKRPLRDFNPEEGNLDLARATGDEEVGWLDRASILGQGGV